MVLAFQQSLALGANVSQTSIVFAAIFFAFVVFITMRNELGQYLSLLGL